MCRKVKLAAERMERRTRGGMPPEDAWNDTSIELVAAAVAHCRAFMVDKFADAVAQSPVSDSLKTVLSQLAELYAIYWLLNNKGDFLVVSTSVLCLVVCPCSVLTTIECYESCGRFRVSPKSSLI